MNARADRKFHFIHVCIFNGFSISFTIIFIRLYSWNFLTSLESTEQISLRFRSTSNCKSRVLYGFKCIDDRWKLTRKFHESSMSARKKLLKRHVKNVLRMKPSIGTASRIAYPFRNFIIAKCCENWHHLVCMIFAV